METDGIRVAAVLYRALGVRLWMPLGCFDKQTISADFLGSLAEPKETCDTTNAESFDDCRSRSRPTTTIDKPLTRQEGAAPAWNDAEIDHVIASLKTPTDADAQAALGL